MAAKRKTRKKAASNDESAAQEYDPVLAMSELNDMLSSSRKKAHAGMRLMGLDEIMIPGMEVRNLLFQWLIGRRTIPQTRQMDLVGPTGIGKTTLGLWLAGQYARQGSVVLHLEAENKPMDPDRIRRILSPDPETAERLMRRITTTSVRTLEEYWETLLFWTEGIRNRSGKLSQSLDPAVPILVILDPFSKLMSPDEAKGFYEVIVGGGTAKGKGGKKAQAGTPGQIANFGHSKFAQQFSRREGHLLERNNVNLLNIHHQNDNSPSQAMMSAVVVGQMFNTTKIGGKALDQLSSIMWVIGNKGQIKRGDLVVGNRVQLRTHKNSIGIPNRKIEFELLYDHGEDEPVVQFHDTFAEWCMEHSLLGVTGSNRKYSCPVLGLKAVPAQDLFDAVHSSENADILEDLGVQLKIKGYGQTPVLGNSTQSNSNDDDDDTE